jgi:hypothetical protein
VGIACQINQLGEHQRLPLLLLLQQRGDYLVRHRQYSRPFFSFKHNNRTERMIRELGIHSFIHSRFSHGMAYTR